VTGTGHAICQSAILAFTSNCWVQSRKTCKLWGFCSSVAEDSVLQEYWAMSAKWVPTFQGNLMSSSRTKPQRWNYVSLKRSDLITHWYDFISQKNRILKKSLSLKLVSQLRPKRRTSQMHVKKPYCMSQFAKK